MWFRYILLLTLLASASLGSGWPSFRGENGSGVAASTGLPVDLGPSKNLVWQTPLPPGTSSPVLSGDKIFLTALDGKQLLTICVRLSDGKILWRQPIEQARMEARHNLNHAASATPVTDGKNVFAFFSDFGLVSYGPDGNRRWTHPLGPFHNLHGMGTSPILAGNALILVCDQDTGSFILAVHKDTGKMLWRAERPEIVHGFSTPTLFEAPSGEQQLIIPTSYMLVSYSVQNGKELWRVRGLTWQLKTTAVVSGGVVYATGWAPGADPGQANPVPAFEEVLAEIDTNKDGLLAPSEITPKYKHSGSWQAIDLDHDGFLNARDWSFFRARRSSSNVTMAVRPGNAKGDLTQTHVLWRNERFVPQVSSPLLYRDVLYTIKDGGILTSLNPATGATYKTARVPGALDNYYSSPVAADGKLYIASETGKVSVIRAQSDWEVLAVNDFDEAIYATPAIEGNRIYLRTARALYCFASVAQAPSEEKR
ncbi:MAG: PQQ-binding-like beta-propeller repeat protein [Acidobacteriia bacterium]|nr:PQQ-binding-like beta-propeller repeat protein [Terriglobia bacterium]